MTIDPARLARIRARVLAAAAAVTIPACGGGVPPHVNEPPDERKPFNGPINERSKEPVGEPRRDQVLVPEKDEPRPEVADPPDINRPKPDAKVINTPEPPRIPPPGQTINVVQADPDRPPSTINTAVAHPPAPAPAKPIPHHVNTPDEKR